MKLSKEQYKSLTLARKYVVELDKQLADLEKEIWDRKQKNEKWLLQKFDDDNQLVGCIHDYLDGYNNLKETRHKISKIPND